MAWCTKTAKKRYSNLVEAIRTGCPERINRLEWMSAPTKSKAQQVTNQSMWKPADAHVRIW